MSAPAYDPSTDLGPPIAPVDPYLLFCEDLIYDERDFPQMTDPERMPVWEVRFKDHVDDRTPDIETRRTKAYIVGWERRKDHPTLPQRE